MIDVLIEIFLYHSVPCKFLDINFAEIHSLLGNKKAGQCMQNQFDAMAPELPQNDCCYVCVSYNIAVKIGYAYISHGVVT